MWIHKQIALPKNTLRVPCKSSSDNADLQTLTQTLCLKRAKNLWNFLCLLIFTSSTKKWPFADIWFQKSNKNIYFASISFLELSGNILLEHMHTSQETEVFDEGFPLFVQWQFRKKGNNSQDFNNFHDVKRYHATVIWTCQYLTSAFKKHLKF